MKLRVIGLLAAFLVSQVSAIALFGQCGGNNYRGATACDEGSTCVRINDSYSQCLATSVPVPTAPIVIGTVDASSCPSSSPPAGQKFKFFGVNIAGFEFGCNTDGTCATNQVTPPLTEYSSYDGAGQMSHFVNDNKFNTFRLPVAWQYLTSSPGATLNTANFEKYDKLVQACLNTGAYCIIDIHNYGRWNGQIIGQSYPTDAHFTSLWNQIASKYASKSKVIFGIMNEPHNIPSLTTWVTTVQAAVTQIRQAGATSQYILLPGNDWSNAATFVSSGSADALSKVTNLDGSTSNLLFDVHKYLDSDNTGTHADCTTDNIAVFNSLAQWLRCNKRQALNSETGGGNTASCATYFCQQLAFQQANADVIVGVVGWAAGSFDATYVLNEGPTRSGQGWVDTSLVKSCMIPTFWRSGETMRCEPAATNEPSVTR